MTFLFLQPGTKHCEARSDRASQCFAAWNKALRSSILNSGRTIFTRRASNDFPVFAAWNKALRSSIRSSFAVLCSLEQSTAKLDPELRANYLHTARFK